jgi:hypothetical protein
MGEQYQATCGGCGHHFEAEEGGGFFFDLFRCELCGITKGVTREAYEQYWLRHLLSLKGKAGIADRGFEKYFRADTPRDPMTIDEFEAAAEATVGKCECGGQYRFHAPVRCPICKSADIKKGKLTLLYD